MIRKVLIIEDDDLLNRLVVRCVSQLGHDVTGTRSWKEASAYLEHHEPHLVIMDVRLPDGDSLPRLQRLVERQPVIVLTAYGSVQHAVEAMKAGASEYLVKPVSPEELNLVVQRVLETAQLREDHSFCKQRLTAREGSVSFLIGESQVLGDVRQLIEAVAPTDVTVLIQGESGTGKELVARALHDASERSHMHFVAVDCCTLQAQLFESELFGHERGAFTGADRLKKGLIEGAEGGTLFLDEIGEIEPSIQAKLLRILETGKFRRLGGTKDLDANVRVVAATNRDLEAMTLDSAFRADLYFRLSAFVITTPPLRERREDIVHLATHFLRNHNFSRRIDKTFGVDAIRKLVAYDWPGNVRELKNAVERAIILSRDRPRIGIEHLAFLGRRHCPEISTQLSFERDPTLEELEARYLALQLKKFSGHRSKVAEVLGISERNLYRLIKRYGLTQPQPAH